MALAVDFDRQLRLVAIEVEDIAADGMLPAKVQTAELARTNRSPDQALRQAETSAQILRKILGGAWRIHG
jgi:hypothetical protein